MGMHEAVEAFHHLASAQAGGGHLDELAALEREARRLGVKDDYVLLEEVERGLCGAALKTAIALGDLFRSARQENLVDGRRQGSHPAHAAPVTP